MMWASRQFGIDDWFAVQDRFEALFLAAGGPREMMLISTKSKGLKTRLLMGLPDPRLLSNFEGFEPVAEADLPKQATFLVGYDEAFNERFSIPSR